MRVLQLSKWLSVFTDTGGKARSVGLGTALARFAEVDVVGFGDPGGDSLSTAGQLDHYRCLYPVRMERGAGRAAQMCGDALRGYALRSCRFRSRAYRQVVAEVLRASHYDAIQVEELSILQNLDPWPRRVPVVYSAHNVESTLSPQLLRARGPVWKVLESLEARRAASEEDRALANAKACLAVSAQDKRALERVGGSVHCPIHIIPNCVGDEVVPGPPHTREDDAAPEVINVGSFGWAPNVEGARWFLADVLPRLNGVRCVVRFVGSAIDPRLAAVIRSNGCESNPNVPDTVPYLHRARVAFVPLQVGGGTRIKIVEAWAAGVPVVSTPLGAEGLECNDGVDALLASDARSFAKALISVIEDDTLYTRLRTNGLQRATTLRWGHWAGAIEAIYKLLVSSTPRE